MSTLRVNTIQDTAGSGSPAINGLAKAWVNFNGTNTVAIRRAFNVSSITDYAAGTYGINFTTSMPDTTYSLIGSAGTVTGGYAGIIQTTELNTTYAYVEVKRQNDGSQQDSSIVTFAVFR